MVVQKFKWMDEHGNEIPDPTPIAIPAGFKVPESLSDQIRRIIQTSVSEQAQEQGMETFEESEDFDIDDDMFDPSSPYEEVFDPVLGRGITLDEFKKNEAIYRQRYLEAEQRAYDELDKSDALRARPRPVGTVASPPATGGAGVPPAPSKPDGEGVQGKEAKSSG